MSEQVAGVMAGPYVTIHARAALNTERMPVRRLNTCQTSRQDKESLSMHVLYLLPN